MITVLARARDFLPQLKEANKKLEVDVQNNVDVNIEQVDESKPYIQMVLIIHFYFISFIINIHWFIYFVITIGFNY